MRPANIINLGVKELRSLGPRPDNAVLDHLFVHSCDIRGGHGDAGDAKQDPNCDC